VSQIYGPSRPVTGIALPLSLLRITGFSEFVHRLVLCFLVSRIPDDGQSLKTK
jgi:hypothetical protein